MANACRQNARLGGGFDSLSEFWAGDRLSRQDKINSQRRLVVGARGQSTSQPSASVVLALSQGRRERGLWNPSQSVLVVGCVL